MSERRSILDYLLRPRSNDSSRAVGRELQRRWRQLRGASPRAAPWSGFAARWLGRVAAGRSDRTELLFSAVARRRFVADRVASVASFTGASLPAARRGKRQQADADLLGCMKGLLAPRFAESSLPADAAAPSRPAATARHRHGCFRAKLAHRFCKPSLRAAGLAFILFIGMPSVLPHLPACSVGRPGPSEAPQPRRAAMPL
jgi:hypothetical protein